MVCQNSLVQLSSSGGSWSIRKKIVVHVVTSSIVQKSHSAPHGVRVSHFSQKIWISIFESTDILFGKNGYPTATTRFLRGRTRVNVGLAKDCHSVVPHPSFSCLKVLPLALNVILNLIRLTPRRPLLVLISTQVLLYIYFFFKLATWLYMNNQDLFASKAPFHDIMTFIVKSFSQQAGHKLGRGLKMLMMRRSLVQGHNF